MCKVNEEVLIYEADGCHVYNGQHSSLVVLTVKEAIIIGRKLYYVMTVET